MSNIFDLLDDDVGPETVVYRTMVLEYGITLHGKPHYRCMAWGGDAHSIEEAQEIIRKRHPDVEFTNPPTRLHIDNLGDHAYRKRWNGAFITREDTGQVISVGWLTPPGE